MSSVFTTGKKSSAIVKGRDDDFRQPKRQMSNGSDISQKDIQSSLFPVIHFTSQIMRSVGIYKPTEDTIVWNPKIDGKELSLALRKSSMEIWFEDKRLEYFTSTDENVSRMDFRLMGKKAVIINRLKSGSEENTFELQVEGEEIPQMGMHSEPGK